MYADCDQEEPVSERHFHSKMIKAQVGRALGCHLRKRFVFLKAGGRAKSSKRKKSASGATSPEKRCSPLS
jgi:hypothetical protein